MTGPAGPFLEEGRPPGERAVPDPLVVAEQPLAYDASEGHPWVAAALAERIDLGRPDLELDLAIDARDEMLDDGVARCGGDRDAALAAYFDSGYQVARSIEQLESGLFAGGEPPASVLDFGCGYGRVTRFLVPRHGRKGREGGERLWASDILPGALEFQRRRFGVRTLRSEMRPEDFECSQRFDLIYVGSLFTHLPHRTFGAWIERLTSLLGERGVLALTVHHESLMPPRLEMPELGLCFEASSESRTLDHQDYGSAWVTPDYLAARVGELNGFALRRIGRGICNYQDLVLVAREGAHDLEGLRLDGGPDARIEHCEIEEPGHLLLSGWAISRFAGARVSAIEVRLDGELIGRSEDLQDRPDCYEHLDDVGLDEPEIDAAGLDRAHLLRSGWECCCRLPVPLSRNTALLTVTATSDLGVSNHVFVGSLERALYVTSYENYRRHYQRVFELEEIIEAMKQSRFWKIRSAWFWVKRVLRLTDEH